MQIKITKQLRSQFYFSFIVIGISTYLNSKYPFSLGGSFLLILLSAAFVVLSLKLEKLPTILSFLHLIVAGIMGINFLSYWEMTVVKITVFYLFIFYGLLLWLVIWYLSIIKSAFKTLGQLNEPDQHLIKQIRRTLEAPIFVGTLFSYFSGLMVNFIHKVEPQTYNNPLFKISYVAIAMIIIFLFITFIYLLKIRDEDIKRLLFKTEEKYNLQKHDMRKIRKYSLLISVIIIISGSVIETQRGMWVMWIETVFLLGLISLILWKIYKHVFSTKA